MKPPRKYVTAVAFRVALEARLKKLAQEESLDLQRLRRQVAFDRLLCRLFAGPDAPWLLKGGQACDRTGTSAVRPHGKLASSPIRVSSPCVRVTWPQQVSSV
jgi:hypothetical protein